MITSNAMLSYYISVACVLGVYVLYHFFCLLNKAVRVGAARLEDAVRPLADARPLMTRLGKVRGGKTIAKMEICVLDMEEEVLKHQIKKRVANRGKQ